MSTHAIGTNDPDGLETIHLACPGAKLQAAFAPRANLVLHSLKFRGRELLAQNDGLSGYFERATTMGIPLLHPWANRLSELRYTAAGQVVALERDDPRLHLDPNGLPIHGVVPGLLAWDVLAVDHAGDAAHLHAGLAWERSHPGFELFPFPHRLDYHALVTEATIEIRVRLEPTEDRHVPASFGFHPYLLIPGGSRVHAQMTLPARRRLVLDESMIPTGETAAIEHGPHSLGASTLDDGFCEVPAGVRFLIRGGDEEVSLTFLRGYPFAQVYSPADSDFICFEPMTAPTNALVRGGASLTLVAPGQTYEAGFELAVAS